jgi:hypothetical protein
MIFRTLSREEYERLTPDQKLDYLRRLMEDISEKAMQVRRAINDRGHSERAE